MKRTSILEVSKSAFKHNINEIKKNTNKEIMPIIKASAYGTYINRNLELIKDFNIVGVALISEAIELRKIGFKNEIFTLYQPYIEDIDNIWKYDITVGVCDLNFIKELSKLNHQVKVHLEIETGMGRTGIFLDKLDEIIDVLKKSNDILVEGVYTHLSSADIDEKYTKEQIETFRKGVNIVKEYFDIKYVHCEASPGIEYDVDFSNLIRPGLSIYGYKCYEGFDKLDLMPVAKLKTKISYIKEVPKGTSISYGRTYITDKTTRVATVNIGYADGVKRGLSNKGYVVINGKKVPIIGRICMDSFMIDVTDIECKVNDDVYIWDNELITLDEIAEELDTISYEIISTITDRVERVFVE
ncbi:MAG: alanine racemase [Bacilli bacterium]|nr:alanine racemase [Bacilli bacterium]